MTIITKLLVAENAPDFIVDLPINSRLSEVEAEIEELARLAANWNDEGASAIDPTCISRAREFIRRLTCEIAARTGEKERPPTAFPAIDGGLRLYWKTPEQQMSLVFRPGQSSIEVIEKARGQASGTRFVSEEEAGKLAVHAVQEGV